MPHGGSRVGAGRPKGSKKGLSLRPDKTIPDEVARAAIGSGMTPLEYMLKVMRNDEADQGRRDRMAVAAAPYCHAKVADASKVGKKDAQAAAAETAGQGSQWAGDLEFDGGRPN